ncbi:MAG: ribosome maturation factor RimP [Candidatus Omnitrophica bacterium]|nr:ribosome maturation factor RimP [Candidatus Omnitrophota bacterium]
MLNPEEIIQRVRALVEPVLKSRQAQLVELTCRWEGSRVVLRFLVDTSSSITLDELSRLNQTIGIILDEHDVIPDRYVLEVNSPGLDRPLKSWLDFERMIGRRLKVEALDPAQVRRQISGELLGANEEIISLRLDSGEKLQIRLTDIARAVQEVKL